MVETIPNKETEKNKINLDTNKFDLDMLKNKTELLTLKKTIPGKEWTYYRNDKWTIRTITFKNWIWLNKKVPAQWAKIYWPSGTFDNARLRGTEAKQVKEVSQQEIRSELADYMNRGNSTSEIIRTYKPDPKHPGQYIQTPHIQVIWLESPAIDPIDIISWAFIGGMMYSWFKTAARFVLTKWVPAVIPKNVLPQMAKAGAAELWQNVAIATISSAIN